MGKFILLLGSTLLSLVHLFAQTNEIKVEDVHMYKNSAPWHIDGKINDWEKLLGKSTGNPLNPFQYTSILETGEKDSPEPPGDLQLTNYVSDEHNVYLYFRRTATSSDPYTFTFYFDLNANRYLEIGEPVLTATFSPNEMSPLSIGYNSTNKSTIRTCTDWSSGSTIHELFNSASIPEEYALTNKEEFSAAITEDGLGVELAVPWRYLKFWNSNSRSLKNSEMFKYLLTLKNTNSETNSDIWDGLVQAGSLNEEQIFNNDLKIEKTITAIASGYSYRLAIKVTNESNLTTYLNLKDFVINSIVPIGSGFDESAILIKRYIDNNCDGEVLNEQPIQAVYTSGSLSELPITYKIDIPGTLGKFVDGFGGTVCFIIDITFDTPISNASVDIVPKAYVIPYSLSEPCLPPVITDGGKPISPVGFTVEESFVNSPLKVHESTTDELTSVVVYPNPSKGSITVALPKNESSSVNLLDNSGRVIRKFGAVNNRTLSIQNLQNGVYYLQVTSEKTGKRTLKKIVIQK